MSNWAGVDSLTLMVCGSAPPPPPGQKTRLFCDAIFVLKIHRFTKTGSGQTYLVGKGALKKGVMMRFFLQGRHCHALTSVRRPATARLAWSRAGRRRAAGRAARWRRRAPAWRSARRCARPRAATATATPAARTSTRTSRCSPARAAPRGSRGRRNQRDSRPTPTAVKTRSGTALKAASTRSGQAIDRNLRRPFFR